MWRWMPIVLTLLLASTALAEDTKTPAWDMEQAAASTPIGDAGLRYVIEHPGTGEVLTLGHVAVVNYSGWLPDGTPFDSNTNPTFEHVEPFETNIPGRVIRGWNEGLVGMQVGETRRLFIPAVWAYGATRRSPEIGPDQDLVFSVELLAIKPVVPWTDEDDEQAVAGE
ncbi:MAG: FKBP-type peptidyl-prolyl cis-trans isomerase, partial [bacterium]